MIVIDGQLPQGIEWRILLALEPGQEPGIAWSIGAKLARVNRGDLVVAILLPESSAETLRDAAIQRAADLRARQQDKNGADVFVVVVECTNFTQTMGELIKKAGIDLVLSIATQPNHHDYRKIPCAVGLIRLAESGAVEEEASDLKRILIPTSGGRNSAYALGLMMMLGSDVDLTGIYIASESRGENEIALGRERLSQVLDFVHAGDEVQSRLIVHENVAAGILQEAQEGYDLVVIGASEESRMDQIIFGNIPAVVVEQSTTPVMIVRQNHSRIDTAVKALDWRLHTILPQKPIGERAEIYARIRRGARPETPFFVLIALSAMIASLGLIVNSPAVVIGAMLVAPLMSPIIGVGLAIVLGDARFLRLALGAVNRGTLLAILVGFIAGLLALNRPFSDEILARTQPNLFDLGIAIFSGAAAAYALSFSQAAGALPGVAIAAALVPPLSTVGITLAAGLAALFSGRAAAAGDYLTDSLGAILLFTTNLIAISTAAAFVFFVLGFRPTPAKKARREVQRRSSTLALALLLVVSLLLGLTSLLLARENATEGRIYSITETQVTDLLEARVAEIDIVERSKGNLSLNLTVISPNPIPHSQVVKLQQQLADEFYTTGIADNFALTMSVIRVTELNPLVPPEAAETTGSTSPDP